LEGIETVSLYKIYHGNRWQLKDNVDNREVGFPRVRSRAKRGACRLAAALGSTLRREPRLISNNNATLRVLLLSLLYTIFQV